jgi:hypothetical protein
MARTTVVLKDWAHTIKLFGSEHYGGAFETARLYRGQSDESWLLSDSLSRLIPDGMPHANVLAVEQQATRYFFSRASLYLDSTMVPAEGKLNELWAIMQHFGAPTRLLDWSLSPYIALYFAVAENWDRAGAVWAVELFEKLDDHLECLRLYLQRGGNQETVYWDDPNSPDFCFFLDLGKHHIRSATQQGHFSVCGRIPSEHGRTLARTAGGKRSLRKLIIRPELKPRFLHNLKVMNIAPHSLFPGLDGLGATTRDAVRLALHPPEP